MPGAKKVFVLDALPEWATSADGSIKLEFHKKLKVLLQEAAPTIKYVVMFSNPNEWYQ